MAKDVLDRDEVEGVLSGAFYAPAPAQGTWSEKSRPTHYKVICISMYTKDLERLDELVSELKAKGNTKMSRSALIRAALEQIDLEKVPRSL